METLLEHAGGESAIRRFVGIFYDRVLADPLLQPVFGKGKPDHVDHLTAFEVETFGGPDRYTKELGGFYRIIAVHRYLKITEDQRQRFVALYMSAADEAGLPSDSSFRQALREHVEFGTHVAMQNSHARTDAELHPLKEVPKWGWPKSEIDQAASVLPAPDPFPGHEGGLWQPVASRVVASWPRGSFAENLAVDEQGTVFVSLHSHKRVERYDPVSGQLDTFVELPAPVAGLAFASDGMLWASGGNLFATPGYVWRITQSRAVEEWVQIPDAVFMNGCAWLNDEKTLLICESITGRILAVDRYERKWRAWINDDQLRPVNKQTPGANGIKWRSGHVFVSVTDLNRVVRIAVHSDFSAGPIETVAENLRADDFAFASSGGLYITTHPANTVLRLGTVGDRVTVAGPEDGAVGSTSCAFGRGKNDKTALYVTTSGGLWTPYRGAVQEARLLRLEVGETGDPLPASEGEKLCNLTTLACGD
jgi:hemoglobin